MLWIKSGVMKWEQKDNPFSKEANLASPSHRAEVVPLYEKGYSASALQPMGNNSDVTEEYFIPTEWSVL